MTESENLNTLLEAMEHIDQPEVLSPVYKVMYEPDTGIILGTSCEELTGKSWIEVSYEEYAKHTFTPDPGLRVIDGKIQTYVKESRPNPKRVTDGEDVFTDATNMLLIKSPNSKRRKGRKVND